MIPVHSGESDEPEAVQIYANGIRQWRRARDPLLCDYMILLQRNLTITCNTMTGLIVHSLVIKNFV